MDVGETVTAVLPARPLLLGLYHVVPLGADRVQVSNAGRSIVLSGEGFTERVGPLLAALDGRTPLDQLRGQFPDLVPSVLEALLTKGLLADGSEQTDGAQAAPQRAALALPGPASVGEAVDRLSHATVAVVGCGPVGGAVALLLAKAGVGCLLLADAGLASPDDVAVSPVLAPRAEGSRRDEATRDLPGASAGSCEVVPLPLSPDLLPQVDLAVIELGYEADGGPSAQAASCLAAGTPHLLYTQDALEAVVGPLVQPGGEPCHRCMESRRLSHVPHIEEHLAYRNHRAVTAPRPDAFLAAHSSFLAGMVATHTLKALLGAEPLARGAVFVVDLAVLELRPEEVFPVPTCPGCRSAAAPTAS